MKNRIIYCLAILMFGLHTFSFARNENVGTTGAQFLKIGSGARPIGMGGSFVGLADDVNAIYWNPAGLGQIQTKELTATYTKWFEEINLGCLGYVHPVEKFGTFGVGIVYLTLGGIPTTEIDDSGRFIEKDSAFGAQDMAFNFSYGKNINENLSIGGNLRIINQKLEKETATGFMADIGGLYKWKTTGIGFVLQNIGSGVKFSKDENPLPVNIKLGLSQKLFNKNLTIVLDANLPVDNDISGHLGIEYWYKNIIALRAGYKTTTIEDIDALSGVSAGFGIRLKSIGIDYTFVPYGDLGFTHRISLIGRFGTVPY